MVLLLQKVRTKNVRLNLQHIYVAVVKMFPYGARRSRKEEEEKSGMKRKRREKGRRKEGRKDGQAREEDEKK